MSSSPSPSAPPSASVSPSPEPSPSRFPIPSPAPTRPAWLGTTELELRSDGWGVRGPTPPELQERAFPPRHLFADPTSDEFVARIREVPDYVVARSTYVPGCPVGLDGLRYITMTYWGFDDRPHTGEMIVNASVADDVVGVFRTLYEERYPIEEMRVYSPADRDAPSTGDLNVTSAYACRNVVGTQHTWSQHAYGLAIDLNPFINPYLRGDLLVPELSESYLDRSWVRPGMILEGGVVTDAFDSIGWHWGGRWSFWDLHHFSLNNG